jgi:hypothetical protein
VAGLCIYQHCACHMLVMQVIRIMAISEGIVWQKHPGSSQLPGRLLFCLVPPFSASCYIYRLLADQCPAIGRGRTLLENIVYHTLAGFVASSLLAYMRSQGYNHCTRGTTLSNEGCRSSYDLTESMIIASTHTVRFVVQS